MNPQHGAAIRRQSGSEQVVLKLHEPSLVEEVVGAVKRRRENSGPAPASSELTASPGVILMFSGSGGTGKTLAAEVLASRLSLSLNRVDLSGMVSKYIGETEKNLNRLLGAAERTGAILLFDEADSLFGRRTDVKDSHDRYANLDIQQFLVRLEARHGIAILAVKDCEQIDPEIVKRTHIIVQFPEPS